MWAPAILCAPLHPARPLHCAVADGPLCSVLPQIPRYILTLHELLAHTPHEHVERNSLDYAKSKLEELSRSDPLLPIPACPYLSWQRGLWDRGQLLHPGGSGWWRGSWAGCWHSVLPFWWAGAGAGRPRPTGFGEGAVPVGPGVRNSTRRVKPVETVMEGCAVPLGWDAEKLSPQFSRSPSAIPDKDEIPREPLARGHLPARAGGAVGGIIMGSLPRCLRLPTHPACCSGTGSKQSPAPKVSCAVLAGTCPPVALVFCASKAETFQCHLLPSCANPSLGPAGWEPGCFWLWAVFSRAP